MSEFDWRSTKDYGRTEDAEITGLAWECLRRNPNYKHDCRGISSTTTVSDEFRRKWGLCFRS